ncbi:membrane progestin receptor delta, partial [Fukomys damarensis]|uniref:membrane progestin receptor delta n=1 Tax=Fukomys damarensis TaxID=885580 RepID=UPI0005402F6E
PAGCAFPYASYSMPASWLHGRLHRLFVPAAALNSFLCTSLSCYSRFPELESPGLSKVLRTAAFAYPFLFDNLPLFYRLGLCWGRTHSCGQEALSSSHTYHLLCALLTGFLFASRLPERLGGTVATLALAVAGNLLIIAAFTAALRRAPGTCPPLQGVPAEGRARLKEQ